MDTTTWMSAAMSGSRRGLGPLLVASLVLATSASEAATLRWKLREGEVLRYQRDQKTVTKVSINGQDNQNTNSQVMEITWKVKSVGADGSAEIEQTVDHLTTRIESNFGVFEFDSKVDKEPESPAFGPLVKLLKAMVGAPYIYRMNPRGELSDVKVPDSLVQAMKNSGPMSGMFSEEGLKNLIREFSLVLPEEDLAAGKSWTRPTKLPPSPLGIMSEERVYTYEGPGEGAEKIGMAVKMTLEPAANAAAQVKLDSQEAKGSYHFDNTAGRVTNFSMAQKLGMTITVMNQQVTQNSEVTSTMKLLPASK